MSLTKKIDKTDEQVKNFFLKELMPLTKNLCKEEKVFFEPNPGSKSYYLKREKTDMEPADFEVPGCYSVEGFVEDLRKLWTEEGNSEFAILVPAMANLVDLLYLEDEQTEEVSPFLYVMF